jgi:hypothetical protein
MSAAVLVQAVAIALIVVWSALFALHRLLPVTSRRLWARIAAALDRPPLPLALRRLLLRWQPRNSAGGHCGDGCSACGGCGSADKAEPVVAQPLHFRPRSKA